MEHLYRKKSIERLSSPEQLDKLVVLTPPSVWAIVLGMVIIAVSIIIWGIYGSLPTYVEFSGVVYDNTNSETMYAVSSGVIDVKVTSGDTVEEGDILAIVNDGTTSDEVLEMEELIESVNAITIDSEDDISNSTVTSLLEIKVNNNTLSSSLDTYEIQLSEYEEMLSAAEDEQASLQAEYDKVEAEYIIASSSDLTTIQTTVATMESELSTLELSTASLQSTRDAACMTVSSALQALGCDTYTDYTKTYPSEEIVSSLNGLGLNDSMMTQMLAYNEAAITAEADLAENKTSITYMTNAISEYKSENNYTEKEKYFDGTLQLTLYYELQTLATELSTATQTVATLESNIASLGVEEKVVENDNSNQENVYEEEFDITKAAILEELESELESLYVQEGYNIITASCSGVVSNVLVQNAQVVTSGTEVVMIKSTGTVTNSVICYVALSDAKKLEVGMDVLVIPTTVNQNETGYMNGTISSVSDYTASTAEMTSTLGDSLLVSTMQQQGATVEVVVELELDADTVSGFAWSSKAGESVSVSNGTITYLKAVADENAPITKLIPYIKDKLEVDTEEE